MRREKKLEKIPKSKHGGGNKLRGIAVDAESGVMFIASSGTNKVIKTDERGSYRQRW